MIPQLVKMIKTKNTESVSKEMLIISVIGGMLFVISGIGILIDDRSTPEFIDRIEAGLPILIANGVSCIISTITFSIKMVHRKKAIKLGITEGELAKRMLAAKKSNKVNKKAKGK